MYMIHMQHCSLCCRVYERMKADYEASNAAAQEEERLINLLREEQEVGWTCSDIAQLIPG